MKRRTVAHASIPLTPALHYLLMVGKWADARLAGWVALAQVPLSDMDDHVRAASVEHGDLLTLEAQSFGFEPHALTHRTPHGAGFTRWQRAFLAQHRY